MASQMAYVNHIRKSKGLPDLTESDFELISINQARKKVGLSELICKQRECIVCGKDFKSFDASHRVCDKCRPKWVKKRDELEKAFINIENTETFELLDIEEVSIFEVIE
ncbi:MAG: hypothetical protein AB1401_01920 [Thermodesulfobacteriota bacterium]